MILGNYLARGTDWLHVDAQNLNCQSPTKFLIAKAEAEAHGYAYNINEINNYANNT